MTAWQRRPSRAPTGVCGPRCRSARRRKFGRAVMSGLAGADAAGDTLTATRLDVAYSQRLAFCATDGDSAAHAGRSDIPHRQATHGRCSPRAGSAARRHDLRKAGPPSPSAFGRQEVQPSAGQLKKHAGCAVPIEDVEPAKVVPILPSRVGRSLRAVPGEKEMVRLHDAAGALVVHPRHTLQPELAVQECRGPTLADMRVRSGICPGLHGHVPSPVDIGASSSENCAAGTRTPFTFYPGWRNTGTNSHSSMKLRENAHDQYPLP